METKLDRVISDVAYILDSLMTLRNIQETHNCNECAIRGCEWEPKPGQMVRYNCPHYVNEEELLMEGVERTEALGTEAEAVQKVVYCEKCGYRSKSDYYAIFGKIWCKRFQCPMGRMDYCSYAVKG